MFDAELLEEIKQAQKKYQNDLERILKKIPEAAKKHQTDSKIELKPLYTPEDIASTDYIEDISFPGHYPYTRGVFAAGHLSRGLNIRQVSGTGTAEDTNKRWKFLLDRGATALSFVKDDGTGSRPDSDDDRVKGMVGKCGVVLDTLYDYETLFDGIDITKYPVHMIAGTAYALACYLVIAEKRGIPFETLRGSMSNFMRPENECMDIMEYCTKNVPYFNSGYLDMRNVREGGCTADQEIGFGVALAMAGSDMLIEKGFKIDDFLHRITWFVNACPDFFEEVAKFRALRRVWAKIFRERYGAKKSKSLLCRMHCQTYAPTLTKQQPFNNLMRSTIYTLAAFMGGVQSLSVNSFDEALSIPTEFSALLSVRTQQIISLETGITKVIDPLGGSYYIETLTNKLEKKALEIIDLIVSKGGAFKAWDWMCDEVRKAAICNQEELDSDEKLLVGVNTLVDEDDIQTRALKVLQEHADFESISEYDLSIVDRQVKRLNKVRSQRDENMLDKSKKQLCDAMKAGENMVPFLIDAVKCGLTQGEFAYIKAKAYNQKGEGPYVCQPPMVLA